MERRLVTREAEVEDLGVAVLREEDVLGLEVAVDDPLLVGGGEALGDLVGDREGALERPESPLARADGRHRRAWRYQT